MMQAAAKQAAHTVSAQVVQIDLCVPDAQHAQPGAGGGGSGNNGRRGGTLGHLGLQGEIEREGRVCTRMRQGAAWK